MKKFFSLLLVGFLVFSGVRAPELSEHLRGTCWAGAVLEKAADSTQKVYEFHHPHNNPLLTQSGFAPSSHPFDFPPSQNLEVLFSSHDLLLSTPRPSFSRPIALPDKPPRFSLI